MYEGHYYSMGKVNLLIIYSYRAAAWIDINHFLSIMPCIIINDHSLYFMTIL